MRKYLDVLRFAKGSSACGFFMKRSCIGSKGVFLPTISSHRFN